MMNAAVVVQQVYASVGVHQYQRVGLLVVIHAGDVHAVEVFQTIESSYACVFCVIGQKVVSANARIRLFYQNPEATDLFRKVNEYGEELRNKHMAGMPPSE